MLPSLPTHAGRLPDEVWQAFGLRHPLGEHFRSYIDILPEAYDRQTVKAAIATAPPERLAAEASDIGTMILPTKEVPAKVEYDVILGRWLALNQEWAAEHNVVLDSCGLYPASYK